MPVEWKLSHASRNPFFFAFFAAKAAAAAAAVVAAAVCGHIRERMAMNPTPSTANLTSSALEQWNLRI